MLLNLQGSYRGKTLQAPEGTNLMEALHVAGLGSHSACFGAAAVRELQAAEFPSDALWTDRIPELDSLVAALLVSSLSSIQCVLVGVFLGQSFLACNCVELGHFRYHAHQ